MIILVESRDLVIDSYKNQFCRVGETVVQMSSSDLLYWISRVAREELISIEAILFSEAIEDTDYVEKVRQHVQVPFIAMLESKDLEKLLALYRQGVDDVVYKPVHCAELLVRIAAIKRRQIAQPAAQAATLVPKDPEEAASITVFFDGSDPMIDGQTILLPRRERRILEYLASVNGRRVTKAQLFNAIYGMFDEKVDENVIESHISKLRKKLRGLLGFDPINSQRYLGYQLERSHIRVVGDRKQLAGAMA